MQKIKPHEDEMFLNFTKYVRRHELARFMVYNTPGFSDR